MAALAPKPLGTTILIVSIYSRCAHGAGCFVMRSWIVIKHDVHLRSSRIGTYSRRCDDLPSRSQRVNEHGQTRSGHIWLLAYGEMQQATQGEGKRVHTFRISSRSSLNASATDAIQNFRNRSFSALSSSCASFVGKNGGMEDGGGVGEGVRRAGF